MSIWKGVYLSLPAAALALAVAFPVAAETSATAAMKTRDGKDLGQVKMIETMAGLLISVKLKGLPPGPHGFHAYEIGKCEGDFASAGAIYNPLGAKHGFFSEEGPMAGDLPNLIVPANGELEVDLLSPFLTLSKQGDESLLDADGAALIIRERADDYRSDPEGDSGGRIACGVIITVK
jgi:Cu-Zn family superoxide dismutase